MKPDRSSIHADTLDDAMHVLGYVTAQDRLVQMTLTRLFAEGRISELAGKKALALDVRHRTLGLHRQAIVNPDDKNTRAD